jgi:Predicted periplasmic lipoprotein (DUF2279)
LSARLSRLGKRTFAILAAAGLAAPEAARAGGFRVFESTAVLGRSAAGRAPQEFTLAGCCDGVLDEGHRPVSFRLDLRFPPTLSLDSSPDGLLGPPRLQPPRPEPRRFFITIASVGAVAGSALNSFTDGPHESFHFTNEGYFGRNTYAGGGDKASHIVSYYGVSRLLASVYEVFDLSEEKSYTLASGVSVLTGFATELGDGTTRYGFSHEDLVADSLGALSAYVLAHNGLNDLLGFRAGVFSSPDTPEEFRVVGLGKDYSREIYTADLKLAGLARRADRNFGPARFLLVSMTYGVKGYPYALPELRERQVGLELGLNVAEIARGIGVSDRPWWGRLLLTVLDIVRFPYTSVGVRYDINHRKWYGPDNGNTWSFPQ